MRYDDYAPRVGSRRKDVIGWLNVLFVAFVYSLIIVVALYQYGI